MQPVSHCNRLLSQTLLGILIASVIAQRGIYTDDCSLALFLFLIEMHMCSEYNQFIKRENSLRSTEQKVSIIYDKTGLTGTPHVYFYINLIFTFESNTDIFISVTLTFSCRAKMISIACHALPQEHKNSFCLCLCILFWSNVFCQQNF